MAMKTLFATFLLATAVAVAAVAADAAVPTFAEITAKYKPDSNYYPPGFREYCEKAGKPDQNTCAVRLAYAIDQVKPGIFKGKVPTDTLLWKGPDLPTKASGLAQTLPKIYGQAALVKKRADIEGKKGIVFFDTLEGWADGTGHIALWDGKRITDTDSPAGLAYFDRAPRVYFWDIPD
jgi:hypothetical protein